MKCKIKFVKLSSENITRQDAELSCRNPIAGEAPYFEVHYFNVNCFLSFTKQIVTRGVERTVK